PGQLGVAAHGELAARDPAHPGGGLLQDVHGDIGDQEGGDGQPSEQEFAVHGFVPRASLPRCGGVTAIGYVAPGRRRRRLGLPCDEGGAREKGLKRNFLHTGGPGVEARVNLSGASPRSCHCSWRNWWTNCTAIDPSPTAAATRLLEPRRTSP